MWKNNNNFLTNPSFLLKFSDDAFQACLQFPNNESYERGEQAPESENEDQDFGKSEEIKCNKKPMENSKRKLNESSRSALLEDM